MEVRSAYSLVITAVAYFLGVGVRSSLLLFLLSICEAVAIFEV